MLYLKLLKFSICLFLLCFFCGCASTADRSGGRQWFPSTAKLKRAAIDAAKRPNTWMPAVGAMALSVGDADQRLSKWASTHNPVYGSPERAGEASDQLRNATDVAFGATLFALAREGKFSEAGGGAMMAVGTELTALNIVNETTSYIKAKVGRERPFGGDYSSFPSRHTSSAFANSTLAKRNLDVIDMSPLTRSTLYYSITALSIGTAWGRVEGNVHYPTDVLAGAALANFTTHFFYNAFLGQNSDVRVSVEPEPSGGKMKIQVPF